MAVRRVAQVQTGGKGWVVALDDHEASAVLADAVHAAGFSTVVAAAHGSIIDRCAGRAGLIVEMGAQTQSERRWQLRRLRREHPQLSVILHHEPSDVATAWTAMRAGATPWCRRSDGRSSASDRTAIAALVEHLHGLECRPLDRVALRRDTRAAVLSSVLGRTDEAISALCSIPRAGGADVALEVLTEDAAELFRRLEARSQYPIPLECVLDRLDVGPEDGLELCVSFLCGLVVRDADDLFPRGGVAPGNRTADQLFGAFHTMSALVRFAAARWWTDPTSVLHRLHDGSGAEQPALAGSEG